MRQKRAKAYKRLMALYHLSFGFREPYQVLVDSGMCTSSVSLKLDIVKQFSTVLQGTVKPMITQCCIVELYKLGREAQPVVDLAKEFERRKCNHREAICGDDCIASVVGDANQHRYVIATQSQALRSRLRTVPGVPIVHLNRTVLVLEPPSDATLEVKRQAEEKALLPTTSEKKNDIDASEEPRKKRKGPKGPNPLSIKKKKVRPDSISQAQLKRKREDNSDDDAQDANSNNLKRKRRKKRPASHPNDAD